MPTGKFARSPMRNDDSAAIAAVLVIMSFWTSATQDMYVTSESQLSVLPAGQIHGPPESAMIDAFTDIWQEKGC